MSKEKGALASVGDKVQSVKKYIGGNLVAIFAFIAMNIVFIFICTMNFAEMKMDFERLKNTTFWVNYSLLTALGLVMFFLATLYSKSKNKKNTQITDIIGILSILKAYLEDNCLSIRFDEYLVERNKKNKLLSYKESLRLKAYFCPFKNKRLNYLRRAENVTIDTIDNEHYRLKNILTSDLIFVGVPSKKTGEKKVKYSGREGLGGKLIPSLLISMFIQFIVLSLVFSTKSTNIDAVIQLLAKCWVMLTYAVRGVGFGDYSINSAYYAVLENRRGIVTEFLAENNINIVIKENETYKYKVEEVKPETTK